MVCDGNCCSVYDCIGQSQRKSSRKFLASVKRNLLPMMLLVLLFVALRLLFLAQSLPFMGSSLKQEDIDFILPCNSSIYCFGDILFTVQMTHAVGNDSKYFVDMPMKHSPEVVHGSWALFTRENPHPTTDQISDWVNANFDPPGHGLAKWKPSDWRPDPDFANDISNKELRQFAVDLNEIWLELARKQKSTISKQPSRFSSLELPNGVVIPGGRFREIYYWDTYWIVEGLLVSGMTTTAKGVVDNLISFVDYFGFVPNGGRKYYENRSQPPLLIQMAWNVFEKTKDSKWLAKIAPILEQEYSFWINNRTIDITLSGQTLSVARYATDLGSPRPESFSEDMATAGASTTNFTQQQKTLFSNLGSGAESGADFSTRWFDSIQDYDSLGMSGIRTRDVVPVDLNSILCGNELFLSKIFNTLGDKRSSEKYLGYYKERQRTIEAVFWDNERGFWFDYNINNKARNYNFYAPFIAPWWQKCVNTETGVPDRITENSILQYLESQGIFQFPGGVPYSLTRSGQQWDLPNVWAPATDMLVTALSRPTSSALARRLGADLAGRWVGSAYKGFAKYGQMFEKYDCDTPGEPGGGGEYTQQVGFGWTNGVTLKYLDRFGKEMKSPS